MITAEPTNRPRATRAHGLFLLEHTMNTSGTDGVVGEILGNLPGGFEFPCEPDAGAANSGDERSASTLLLTADSLARQLQISKRSLQRLRSAGKLPKPVSLGGSVRWVAEEIVQWVKAGCPAQAMWQPTVLPETRKSRLSRRYR